MSTSVSHERRSGSGEPGNAPAVTPAQTAGGLIGIYPIAARPKVRHARKMADRRIFTIAFGIILPLAFIVAVALIVLLEMPLMNYMTFFSR